MKVENGRFSAASRFAGNPPTHGVYEQSAWHSLGADAIPVSLHYDFDSAVSMAARLEAGGLKCTLVCFEHSASPLLRVLLMEDDEKDRLFIEQEIARHWSDIQLQWVHCGRQFARTLTDSPVDLVLCDNGGPDFDGKDALALARVLRPNVPFIFVTGAPDRHQEALRLSDADGVVAKDELNKLKDVVAAAFQRRGRTLP